ncbi:hypothetical protein QAD02_017427 [Eretmocerus hayati]|uniref:Uncharacterized protein n=1 Tax=Eretmocerus hayati TaxID=131215 RepID=A0ACC2PDX6_9HYME|nr:hypothetical protein QAD02_017427 [Eretmocerus hayati]
MGIYGGLKIVYSPCIAPYNVARRFIEAVYREDAGLPLDESAPTGFSGSSSSYGVRYPGSPTADRFNSIRSTKCQILLCIVYAQEQLVASGSLVIHKDTRRQPDSFLLSRTRIPAAEG